MGSNACEISHPSDSCSSACYTSPVSVLNTAAFPQSCPQDTCYLFPGLWFYYLSYTTCLCYNLFSYCIYWVSSLINLCVCVCVFLCVWMHACLQVCIHIWACTWWPEVNLGCCSSEQPFILFLEIRCISRWPWSHLIRLSWQYWDYKLMLPCPALYMGSLIKIINLGVYQDCSVDKNNCWIILMI